VLSPGSPGAPAEGIGGLCRFGCATTHPASLTRR
jgi:hypothetical protein